MAPTQNRYNGTHLMFEVDQDHFSKNKMSDYALKDKLSDFIILNPSVTGSRRYRCYGTRSGNSQFDFKRGTTSLAKKLKVDVKAVSLINVGRNQKMPDHFFDLLDPTKPFDSQITMALGRYAETALIKSYIETALKQNKNRQVCSTVNAKGALGAVESGALSMGQLRAAKAYQAEVAKEKEISDRLARDIPKGEYVAFKCFKTDILYKIFSLKGDAKEKDVEPSWSKVKSDDGTVGHILASPGDNFTKRKHYFFYSVQPGYGKTTFISNFKNYTNSAMVVDLNNWTNVQDSTQFLIVDEYGVKSNRFNMDDLKRLTSGDASNFSGNRKSYGSSYTPRADAQVIIFSNHHLFECMGVKGQNSKDGVRRMSKRGANILSDRFHIYRLDEIPAFDPQGRKVSNEQLDRLKYTEDCEEEYRAALGMMNVGILDSISPQPPPSPSPRSPDPNPDDGQSLIDMFVDPDSSDEDDFS